MKKFMWNMICGKDVLSTGIAAAAILVVLGCNCGDKFANVGKDDNSATTSANKSSDTPFGDDSSGDGVPAQSVSESMVKQLTTEFADAINTKDFSSIYEKASSDFKSTYTEDQMKDAFKIFTDKQSVVVPILRKAQAMTPEFSPSPAIRTEAGLSILVLHGKFSTKPVPTRFEYEFVRRGGEWKMLKLIVKLQ